MYHCSCIWLQGQQLHSEFRVCIHCTTWISETLLITVILSYLAYCLSILDIIIRKYNALHFSRLAFCNKLRLMRQFQKGIIYKLRPMCKSTLYVYFITTIHSEYNKKSLENWKWKVGFTYNYVRCVNSLYQCIIYYHLDHVFTPHGRL